jgi:hypothetical protein
MAVHDSGVVAYRTRALTIHATLPVVLAIMISNYAQNSKLRENVRPDRYHSREYRAATLAKEHLVSWTYLDVEGRNRYLQYVDTFDLKFASPEEMDTRHETHVADVEFLRRIQSKFVEC